MLGLCCWRVSAQRGQKRPSRTLSRQKAFSRLQKNLVNSCTSIDYYFIIQIKIGLSWNSRCRSQREKGVFGARVVVGALELVLEDKWGDQFRK